ncbi:MAG: aldehyde dehydrogenase family protein [Pirellulales bacterium]|nr:aldehyde dehydrogenase family protein [Pirellulales bacterium]
MITLPVIRWGKPYDSLEVAEVYHFATGELIARVSQAGGGIIKRDMRYAHRAREILLGFSCDELIALLAKAADLYEHSTLPLGDGTQSPDDFVRQQSASTGLPEHMCRANMAKNSFVLKNMGKILDCLTRGLDLGILSRGYGEEGRGSVISYQVQSPVLAAVLPSNSPGVHTLWLPAIALQLGLVLKPGPQEPWTPYRIFAAFTEAGVPREAFSLYPGEAEAGAAVLEACDRAMIFGGTATVERYRGNPKVQAHGPGFSKILLGDDVVDKWPDYLDLMAESIYLNSGRGCINCSGVWASRHTREIAAALAARLGPIEALAPTDPQAGLAAFTVPGMGAAVWKMIELDLQSPGVSHATEEYGPRLVEQERASYLRPTIIHASSPEAPVAQKEYMFPFAAVVECPQAEMLKRIGPTLVGTVISNDHTFRQAATNATNIDRLNLGPIATTKLNWLQPHEGNLTDFLFRNRALQVSR